MTRTRVAIVIAAAVAASHLFAGTPSAEALSNTALTIGGTVAYSPGLSDTAASQTTTIAGQGTLAVFRHGRVSPIPVSCSFSGGSTGTETLAFGTGTVSGGCGNTAGESVSVSCGMTYTRAQGLTAVTGVCQLGLVDGTERAIATGSVAWGPTTSPPPVTSTPATMTLDLAVAESPPQYALGSLYVHRTYYNGWPETMSFWMYFSLAGVFVAGEQAEAGTLSCWASAYDGWPSITDLIGWNYDGRATVSCGGTGARGKAVTKSCNIPFSLEMPVALTMGGQCTLTVNGVSVPVFESHQYALTLNPSWYEPIDSIYLANGTHQAVAP